MDHDAEPHSPFGPAPALDATGWRFGVVLDSPTKDKIGFFIDPKWLVPLIASYAQLSPRCSLPGAMMALAFPAPIAVLLRDWRLGWKDQVLMSTWGNELAIDDSVARVQLGERFPGSGGAGGVD